VGFATLYLILFALAVQFSDFRATRYHLPAYPFLFLLVALSLAYWQDRFPLLQRQLQAGFLASVIALGLGTHASMLSLDRPGYALSAKGYAYSLLPWYYLYTHAPAYVDDREVLLAVVQRPFLSTILPSAILPKLSSDDQRDLSRAIALLLALVAPFNGQAEDFARVERLVPPSFNRQFYYQVGARAMDRHPNELPQAVAAVEFLRHRTPAMHHLALVGIYRQWPWVAALDSSPEALVAAPADVAPALAPHYWRALGYWAGRSWYDTERSLSLLTARAQSFVPRLDPSVQRAFLQGVGELLYARLFDYNHWVAPAELERVLPAYQEGLLEGWGMALGEDELFSLFPSTGQESVSWIAATKGLSPSSLVSIQRGKAQFEALFEGAAASTLEPPLHQ